MAAAAAAAGCCWLVHINILYLGGEGLGGRCRVAFWHLPYKISKGEKTKRDKNLGGNGLSSLLIFVLFALFIIYNAKLQGEQAKRQHLGKKKTGEEAAGCVHVRHAACGWLAGGWWLARGW